MLALPDSPLGLALLVGLVGAGTLAFAFVARHGSALRTVLAPEGDVFSLTTGRTGPVAISGTARAFEETLPAPFTGRRCLAVRYEVHELRQSGKSASWVEVDDGVGAVPFLLADDSGSVLVEPGRPRLGLDRAERIHVDGGERPPERVRDFIARSDAVDSEDRTLDLLVVELSVGNDRRYVEYRLEPGEPVTVFGTASQRAGAAERSGQVNAVLAAGDHPLVLSETTPHRTVLRVFWPVLVAAAGGVVALVGALLLVVLSAP